MILVDTSIWIDHLGRGDPHMRQLLESGAVVIHSWIVGEIALGNLGNRLETLTLLMELPHLPISPINAVLGLIDDVPLHGLGFGYVDVQLLTAAIPLSIHNFGRGIEGLSPLPGFSRSHTSQRWDR